MSKVLFFLFLIILFYLFNLCYKGAAAWGATFPLSRAKLQKINEICNLIPQNIFYRVNFT